MRIAMFTETFLPGTDGIVTRLCATLKHLAEEGHEVLLFAPEGGPAEYASARIVGLPAFRFFLYPEKPFALPKARILRDIRSFKPDLIHAVNPAFLGLGGVYAAWWYQIPLIASYHTNVPAYARHYGLNWLEPRLWWYFRTMHNMALINLCTSRATLQELESQGFRNVGLWERGVDVDLYGSAERTDAMRRRLTESDDHAKKKILLYVGRLAAEKGIERLRPCLDRAPDVHLAIVGDGPHRAELERIFSGSATTFTGFLHGRELAEAYASADGFIFPSTTETLGLVLFEAMAAGLPVMAADSPPTREVLQGGRAGAIFDAKSTDSMLNTMLEILHDTTRRAALIRHAREIVAELDWKGPTKQLLGHYERLFSEPMSLSAAVPGP